MALLRAALFLLIVGGVNAFFSLDSFFSKFIPKRPNASKGWEDAGKMLNAAIDRNVDPCEDFYGFACGNWERKAKYNNGRTRHNAITYTQDKIWKEMIGLYTDRNPSGSKIIEQMKLAYGKCMDKGENGVGYLIKKVQEHGGWPILDSCVKVDHDLTDLLILVRNDVLINVAVIADESNTEGRHKFVLSVGASSLDTYNRKTYENGSDWSEQVHSLKNYVHAKIAKLQKDYYFYKSHSSKCSLKGRLQRRVTYQETEKLFDLEVKLFNAQQNTKAERIKFNDLQQIFPEINWNRLVASAGSSHANATIEGNPEIQANVGYLRNLRKILLEDKEDVVNYIFWRYMRTRFLQKYQLPPRYAHVDEVMATLTRNQIVNQPTKAACSMVLSWFTASPIHATSAMYARKYVSKATMNEIRNLTRNIADAIIEIVNENSWMAEETKKKAVDKITQMQLNLFYPEWIMNNTLLDDYYEDLHWDQRDSYSSILDKINAYVVKEQLDKLGTELRREDYNYPSHFANGNQQPNKNSMEFPAAMMQPPFFRADFPGAVNYGAIGYVLGHEYTHTFDVTGKAYDAVGNKFNWWDAESDQAYSNRTQCLVDQYSKYPIEGTDLYVNGLLTLGENIADIEGIKAGYRAYMNFLNTLPSGREESIPHMDGFSNEQNFFISFARQYCSINTFYDKVARQAWDPHAPDGLRIVGVLENMPQFAEAFKCSPRAKMVPEKRCSVF